MLSEILSGFNITSVGNTAMLIGTLLAALAVFAGMI